mmetsp:Transcript_67626/g.207147  ORF Transcript_67626/g.207147 Transcript_67626/m.207147 type:complete len:251 (-) Transcript_67626:457-1209(-)
MAAFPPAAWGMRRLANAAWRRCTPNRSPMSEWQRRCRKHTACCASSPRCKHAQMLNAAPSNSEPSTRNHAPPHACRMAARTHSRARGHPLPASHHVKHRRVVATFCPLGNRSGARRSCRPTCVFENPHRVRTILPHHSHDAIVQRHFRQRHHTNEDAFHKWGDVPHITAVAVRRVISEPRPEAGAAAPATGHVESVALNAFLVVLRAAAMEHNRVRAGKVLRATTVHARVLQTSQTPYNGPWDTERLEEI